MYNLQTKSLQNEKYSENVNLSNFKEKKHKAVI